MGRVGAWLLVAGRQEMVGFGWQTVGVADTGWTEGIGVEGARVGRRKVEGMKGMTVRVGKGSLDVKVVVGRFSCK